MPLGSEQLNILMNHALDAMKAKEYLTLLNMLKIIAMAKQDPVVLRQLEEIEQEMPIYFLQFEKLYFMSGSVDGRRSVVFTDIGKVRFNEIPSLYQTYAIDPLNKVAMKLLGEMSKDKGTILTKYVEGKSTLTKSIAKNAPEVILDA